MSNRLAPLTAPFPDDIAPLLAKYPQRGGYLLALFRTFANSARFLRKGVGNFLDKESPLGLREREIVILRTTARLDCEYEWGVHVTAFASAAGLTDEQIVATRNLPCDANCWRPHETLILRGVDELCESGRVMPATYDAWAEALSLEQQLEIIAVCGNYHTIAFVANTAALPPEPFGSRFPDVA